VNDGAKNEKTAIASSAAHFNSGFPLATFSQAEQPFDQSQPESQEQSQRWSEDSPDLQPEQGRREYSDPDGLAEDDSGRSWWIRGKTAVEEGDRRQGSSGQGQDPQEKE
jgi:hypothetical protein